MSDYHLHLYEHGSDPARIDDVAAHIEQYVEAAARLGVTELGFTEHLFRCEEAGPVLGEFWNAAPHEDLADQARRAVLEDSNLRLDDYVQSILDAKNRGLPVLLGLEVDFFPETIGAVLDLLEGIPFDYLVGSVHWVAGWGIDDSRAAYEFDRRGVLQSYADYFAVATELAVSGAFDVLGHIDVVKKHGHRLPEEPLGMYQRLVKAAARSEVAVEINTSGLRKPIEEMYPSPQLLKMFYEAGVPITLASDGHKPQEAGAFLDEAVTLAESVGYTHKVRFAQRLGRLVPLRSTA